MNKVKNSKDFDLCENMSTHHRNLNDIDNGICILGNFNFQWYTSRILLVRPAQN